jgi:hypothetical protein
MSVAASWKWRQRSAYAFILLSLADFLLTLRLLAAVEAAIIDPSGPGTAQSAAASLLALAVIPCILLALAPSDNKALVPKWQVWTHFALVALVMTHLLVVNQLRLAPLLLLGIAFAIASLVRLRPALGTAIADRTRDTVLRAAAAIGQAGRALLAFFGSVVRYPEREGEEGLRDFLGRQTADFAQGERHLRVGRERRMAAGENEPQAIVLDGFAVRWSGLVDDCFHLLGDILHRVEPRASAYAIDGLEAPGGYQPRARIRRNAVARPLLECRPESNVQRLLGEIEVAQQPDQRGEDASRFGAIDHLGRGTHIL